MKRLVPVLIVLLLAGLACSLSPETLGLPEGLSDPEELATLVAETLAAAGADDAGTATTVAETLAAEGMDIQDVQPPLEDIYQTGTANGHVCYPSEYVPQMVAYFENVDTQEVTSLPIPENQPAFSAPLPAGTYVAYAWLPDFSGGGIYSEAVPCGLSVACSDHSLIEFEVVEGGVVDGIQICDWYTSPSQIPYPPGADYSTIHGSISGKLGYPSEMIPALTVVATNTDTNQIYFVHTETNQSSYVIEHLPPGGYHVVAYLQGEDFAGGYTQAVPCGLDVSCTDHGLITNIVMAGQETIGVAPVDWYAPDGAFPPNPVD